ncbi:SAV_915 family protein [Rhodococcus zopfii]|uniref:SAV_915 family protein n=1 Tax=Rhodococcus zopfii TaxID=43772 RepID=UPI0030B8B0D6
MRTLPDGRLALPAYTSLPELIRCCGPRQAWMSVDSAGLQEIHRTYRRRVSAAAHSRFAEALRGPTTILNDARAQCSDRAPPVDAPTEDDSREHPTPHPRPATHIRPGHRRTAPTPDPPCSGTDNRTRSGGLSVEGQGLPDRRRRPQFSPIHQRPRSESLFAR